MERDVAVRLCHWSNRFIYMYANCFTFVFTHTIKQMGEVLEEAWDTRWQVRRRLFNCAYSFDEIQLLWCYPAKDGSWRALCHVECLFWWKVITSYTDWVCHIGLEAYWTYTGTLWHLSLSVEASLLDHQSQTLSVLFKRLTYFSKRVGAVSLGWSSNSGKVGRLITVAIV